MIDDDAPMADPAIRTEYEAALGAFILMFNEADFYLSQVIGWELQRSGLDSKLDRLTEGSIATRIDLAEALAARSSEPSTVALNFDQLRSINGVRNKLAHGHFDQNPFEGSYQIVVKQKNLAFPSSKVREITTELDAIVDGLRGAYYSYFFERLQETGDIA
jgi:hypothetical protein